MKQAKEKKSTRLLFSFMNASEITFHLVFGIFLKSDFRSVVLILKTFLANLSRPWDLVQVGWCWVRGGSGRREGREEAGFPKSLVGVQLGSVSECESSDHSS